MAFAVGLIPVTATIRPGGEHAPTRAGQARTVSNSVLTELVSDLPYIDSSHLRYEKGKNKP